MWVKDESVQPLHAAFGFLLSRQPQIAASMAPRYSTASQGRFPFADYIAALVQSDNRPSCPSFSFLGHRTGVLMVKGIAFRFASRLKSASMVVIPIHSCLEASEMLGKAISSSVCRLIPTMPLFAPGVPQGISADFSPSYFHPQPCAVRPYLMTLWIRVAYLGGIIRDEAYHSMLPELYGFSIIMYQFPIQAD